MKLFSSHSSRYCLGTQSSVSSSVLLFERVLIIISVNERYSYIGLCFSVKLLIFSHPYFLVNVLGAQTRIGLQARLSGVCVWGWGIKNCHIETVLLSTHSMFCLRNKKKKIRLHTLY